MARLQFTDLFRGQLREQSPAIEDFGLRLHADELRHEDGALTMRLYLSFLLATHELARFRRLERSAVLIVEHPASGWATSAMLQDPHKTYPRADGPNYAGPPESVDRRSRRTRWLDVPIAIDLAPADAEPSLFVRASLLRYQSNTLAVDVGAAALALAPEVSS